MGKSASGGKLEVTEYRLSAHVGVALRLDSVRRILVDEKEAFRGDVTTNTTLNINKPDLFGGEKKEGGLVGAIEVMLGGDTQLSSSQLATRYGLTPTTAPGFRGLTSLFFRGSGQTASGYFNAWNIIDGNWPGNVGGNGFLWRHNQPFIAQKIEVEGTCAPRTTLNQAYALIPNPDHADRPDANPAHMLWEAYVDDEFGMGTDPAGLDEASFEAASETLFNEGFGLSLLWTEQTEIEKIVDEILQHIQGTIFTDPDTGKITLKLHRFDYDVETLPVITPGNAKLSNWQVRSPGEIVNTLSVSWTNPENEKEESITGHVLAAIDSQDGQAVAGSRNYYAVRHAGLARTLLARDLRESTAPDLASCEAVLDRTFWNVKPGDVVKVSWPRRGAYERIMRVGKVNYGRPGSSTIRVSLTQDVFALELPPVAIDPGTGWVDPSADPAPLTMQLTTLPSFFTRNGSLQKGAVDIERPEVLVMSLADSQDDDSLDYELVGEAVDPSGETRILSRGSMSMTPLSELAATMNAAASSELPATLFPDINWGPRIGGFIWFGYGDTNQEIALVTGRTETGWTLERGALDTIPRTWAAGTPVWCVNPGARVVDELTPQAAGATVVYRGLDRTSKGLLAYAGAPDESATLTERPWLPLRPANVAVNGTAFGSLNVSAASTIEITWATRNRLLEDSQPLAWTDGSVAPEYRQETIVRFYDVATGDLVAEYPYLWLDTSISFAKTAFDRWSSVRVEVTSRRDDLEALQAHTVTLTGLAGNPAAPLPPAPAARTTPPQVFPAPAVDAFAAVAGSDEGPDGSSVPTIVVNGTQDDLDADHLVIRYKKTGTTVWRDHPSVPLNGEAVSVEITGVQPTTQYDIEVGYLFGGQPSVYRTLSDVTTGSIVSGDIVPVTPGNISGTPTLSIAPSLGSDGAVRVLAAGDWNDASSAVSYVFELDDGVAVRTLEFAESKFAEIPAIVGRTYRFRAKGKSATATLSTAWSSWSNSVVAGGDTTAPGPVTGVSATAYPRQNVLGWTKPTDADFSHVKLFWHTADITPLSSVPAGSTVLSASETGNFFVDTSAPVNVARHYWAQTFDRSGNDGPVVKLGVATATRLNADYTNDVIQRPVWLDDERVANGLDEFGRVALPLRQDVISASDIVQYEILGDSGFSGDIVAIDAPFVPGSVSETLQTYLNRLVIYPEQFGAAGDGTVDDTLAINQALGTGFDVRLKRDSVYKTTASVIVGTHGQRLISDGDGKIKPVGSFDAVLVNGVERTVIDIVVDGSQHTGGYALTLNAAHRCRVARLIGLGVYNVLKVQGTNHASVDWLWATFKGTAGIEWNGTSQRSDLLFIDRAIVGALGSGYGLIWDGNCHSLEINYLGIVCRAGVTNNGKGAIIRNTSGGTAPAIGKFKHIEIDYPTGHGIEIVAGSDYDFIAPYVLGSIGGSGIRVGNTINTGEVRITGGKLRGNDRYGIENNGGPVYYSGNTDLFDNDLGSVSGNVWTYTPRMQVGDDFYATMVGVNPTIGFAPDDYLAYDTANNSLNLGIGGVVKAAFDANKISHVLKVAAPTFELDATASLNLTGGVVYQAFDANDYASFERATNTYALFIGGEDRFTVTSLLFESTLTFRAPRLEIDGNAYLTVSSGAVITSYDANDYWSFDRAGNQLNFVLNAVGRLSISTSLFESTLVFRAPRFEIGTYAYFTVDSGVVITGLDDNDYWGYDRAANQLNLVIGAVGKLSIGVSLANFTIEVRATRLSVDAAAYLTIDSGSVLLGLDATDYVAYDRANNSLNFVIGGANKMSLTPTLLNSDIEIRSPRLSIDGTAYWTLSTGHPLLVFDANDYFSYHRTLNTLSYIVGGVARFSVLENGNFGVGTASPLTPLHVKGVVSIEAGGTDGNVADAMYFKSTGFPSVQQSRIRASNSAGATGNRLVFETSNGTVGAYNDNQLVLRGDGNIGIGTSAPATKLEVNGTARAARLEAGDANFSSYLSSGIPINAWDANDYLAFNRSGNYLTWVIGASTRMTLSETNFSVGSTLTSTLGGLIIPGANNPQALQIKGGTANHVYVGLYADAAAQGTRSGYFGFGGIGSATMSILNERLGGGLYLSTNGGILSTNSPFYIDSSAPQIRLRDTTSGAGDFRLYVDANVLTIGFDENSDSTYETDALKLTPLSKRIEAYGRRLASEDYVQSRGTNLVTNGTALLADNTNFSWATFDGSDGYFSKGCFKLTSGNTTRISDEVMPVDPSRTYEFSLAAKADPYNGAKHYFGIAAVDADGHAITATQHMRSSPVTTLAAALNPDDTTITLTNSAGWDVSNDQTYRRGIIVWNYVNSLGQAYAPETYSRNVYLDLWNSASDINLSTHVITLKAPWAGPAIPAGTPLSKSNAGGTYKYITASNVQVPNTWTTYSGRIGGYDDSGTNVNNKFPPGTAGIQLLFLLNRDAGASETIKLANLNFSEVPGDALKLNGDVADTAATANTLAKRDANGYLAVARLDLDANHRLTFASGTNPSWVTDSSDYLAYIRSANYWQFVIGNTEQARLSTAEFSHSTQLRAPTLRVDTNFASYLSGSNPLTIYDNNDYLAYIRASNVWQFVIGGAEKARLTADVFQHSVGILAPTITVATDFSLSMDGSNPLLALDANDYFVFNRAGNRAAFFIASNERFAVTQFGIETPRLNLDAGYYMTLSGSNPLLVFDADDFLGYDRVANVLSLTIDGVTPIAFGKDTVTLYKPLVHNPVTVANLPASPPAFSVMAVNDATGPVVGATVAGAGSDKALVAYNGTAWKVFAVL